MRVTLTARVDADACTWCERTKECVTASFDDGFLEQVPLCWRCLQKAVRVRFRTASADASARRASAKRAAHDDQKQGD